MTDNLRKYLHYFLPAIFIPYLGCIVAFTHVHVIDGVTLVHSHPYHTTADGRPGPEHSLTLFQLLHQLSVLQTVAEGGGIDLSGLLLTPFFVLICRPVYPAFPGQPAGGLSPRAPPFF